ncbi:hypothetical protein HPB51_000965 [Rhipicephalus microplus]|uniref:Uncharacterized protein n=1 Tax=Rhipicephalus microplus TaxID=6941 RepID=A0A9J6DL99_RHIMP|nr:hypothetical protein HPB51_000965 [Rhipicephalus microplus]
MGRRKRVLTKKQRDIAKLGLLLYENGNGSNEQLDITQSWKSRTRDDEKILPVTDTGPALLKSATTAVFCHDPKGRTLRLGHRPLRHLTLEVRGHITGFFKHVGRRVL